MAYKYVSQSSMTLLIFSGRVGKYNEPQINADLLNLGICVYLRASAVNRTKGVGGNWKVAKSHYNLGISHLLYLLLRSM